jgi:hypothetical protein
MQETQDHILVTAKKNLCIFGNPNESSNTKDSYDSGGRKYMRTRSKYRKNRQGNLHAMETREANDEIDISGESDNESDFESKLEVDDAEDGIKSKDSKNVSNVPTETECTDDYASHDEWLHAMQHDPKISKACFKFADTGKCPFGTKCQYSHAAEDIAAYKAHKKSGPTRFQGLSKGISAMDEKRSPGRVDPYTSTRREVPGTSVIPTSLIGDARRKS